MSPGTRSTFFAIAATALSSLTAQIPDGWAVASAFQAGNGTAGGLIAFRPHAGATPTVITGLPSDLLGLGQTQVGNHGANCVLTHPDGRLLVGETTQLPGDPFEIHEITLNGFAMATHVRHPIATVGSTRLAADQLAWLPDGRLLVAWWDVQTRTSSLSAIDLATGVVTQIPVSGTVASSRWNAMTLDPTGTTAYLGVNQTSPSVQFRLYGVPVPAGGTATLVATLSNARAFQLATSTTGNVIATFNASPYLGEWNGTSWTRFGGNFYSAGSNAMALDRLTGDLVRVDGSSGALERTESGGTRITLAPSPTSAPLSGIALVSSMAEYGSAMADAYAWDITPNAGGLPIAGNANFSVTARATTQTLPGIFVLGLSEASGSLAGFQLLVNPLDWFGVFLPQPTHTVPLPVPNSVAFIGAQFYLQAIHANTALTSSRGLRVTVY